MYPSQSADLANPAVWGLGPTASALWLRLLPLTVYWEFHVVFFTQSPVPAAGCRQVPAVGFGVLPKSEGLAPAAGPWNAHGSASASWTRPGGAGAPAGRRTSADPQALAIELPHPPVSPANHTAMPKVQDESWFS